MAQIILGLAVAIFFCAFFSSLREIKNHVRTVKGNLRIITLAWAVVFIGQGQIFTKNDFSSYLGNPQIGEYYQIGWMIVGAVILAQFLLKHSIRIPRGLTALRGLTIYGLVGMASAAFSPSPALSFYKASQIVMDSALVMVAISVSIELKNPRVMFELCLFLVTMILASAALGGVFFPTLAFQNVRGAFTGILSSYYPQVHANELGLLSAIVLIVGLRRAFEQGNKRLRFYWIGSAVLASTVLFYAQARTSLASFIVAFIILSIYIPRMRRLAFVVVLISGSIVITQWTGEELNLNIKGTTIETYLRRGATDEQIDTLSGRFYLWQGGWKMFQDAPLIGHGMDAGVRVKGKRYGLPIGTNMHSSHMQILVNTGVMGYLPWIFFVIAVVRTLWQVPGGVGSHGTWIKMEMLLVCFLILFRSFLGHVLVTHQFNLLLFLSIFVYSVVAKRIAIPAKEELATQYNPMVTISPHKQRTHHI